MKSELESGKTADKLTSQARMLRRVGISPLLILSGSVPLLRECQIAGDGSLAPRQTRDLRLILGWQALSGLELATMRGLDAMAMGEIPASELTMTRKTERIDPDFLINAYASGVFPMAMEDGEIGWFAPDPRGIIPLESFNVPHGMKRVIEKPPFEIRIDSDFRGVMRGCADRDETWINESIINTYVELHHRGLAHSVEAWEDGELVGGLYGVSLGAAFFGESMFSRKSEASKLCLIFLVERMRERGFTLLDTQWTNPHLEKFGAIEIPKSEYHRMLEKALAVEVNFVD